jgi:hypothetical protein
MLNPNIYKRVLVEVLPGSKYATYRGHTLEINDLRYGTKPPGRRYMYLKFSILTDSYYLTVN